MRKRDMAEFEFAEYSSGNPFTDRYTASFTTKTNQRKPMARLPEQITVIHGSVIVYQIPPS